MFNWLREWYNIRREMRICDSCEILKQQLAITRQENARLLDRILEKPTLEPRPIETDNLLPLQSKSIPWRVRQQMLEAEDRKRAQLIKESEAVIKTTESLEQEIGVN